MKLQMRARDCGWRDFSSALMTRSFTKVHKSLVDFSRGEALSPHPNGRRAGAASRLPKTQNPLRLVTSTRARSAHAKDREMTKVKHSNSIDAALAATKPWHWKSVCLIVAIPAVWFILAPILYLAADMVE